jgi:hypothetical protein
MTGTDTMFAIGLCVALALSLGQTRLWVWLLTAAVSYTVSVLYWRSGLPYAAFVAGLCDALICLGVYFFGRMRWEMWVWRLFQVSVGVNLYYLMQQYGIPSRLGLSWSLSHNDYSIILEVINWIALLFLGGTGAVQPVGGSHASNASGGLVGGLRRAALPLFRKRTHPPFHRAAH